MHIVPLPPLIDPDVLDQCAAGKKVRKRQHPVHHRPVVEVRELRRHVAVKPGDRQQRDEGVISSGRLDLKPLITQEYALDDAGKAFQFAEEEQSKVLRVVIRP